MSGKEQEMRIGLLGADLLACLAKPSLPLLEIENGLKEVFLAEIRPTGLGKIELSIGQLIEQEIADAVLSAGTDHQFRIRKGTGG